MNATEQEELAKLQRSDAELKASTAELKANIAKLVETVAGHSRRLEVVVKNTHPALHKN